MQTYKHFFRACRIPGDQIDRLHLADEHNAHFIVASRNQVSLLRDKSPVA